MERLFGFIILQNIPKESVRLDAVKYSIAEGFRGFDVVPEGTHYVSIQSDHSHPGFWCYLEFGQVITKVFNSANQTFEDADSDIALEFEQLAITGALSQHLIPYSHQGFQLWRGLTNRIISDTFPPTLAPIPDSTPNRFEQAFGEVHQENIPQFLSEFQFAFIRWYVDNEDKVSLKRWTHLLQSIYNAGERRIIKTPYLFCALVDTLIAQFDLILDSEFTTNSPVGFGARYLSQDMIDSDIDEVVEKGRIFDAYLDKRGL